MRAKLHVILGKARAAPEVPWPRNDVEYYQLVFPQMCNWLPGDEARQLRAEFAAEAERLLAA